jgi:hypothetical protein
MKAANLIILLFFIVNTGWAIEKEDPMSSIGSGSIFVVTKDLTILANTNGKWIDYPLNPLKLSCRLYYNQATKERILKAGTVLTVSHAIRIKDGWFEPLGSSAVVFFENATVPSLKCYTGTGNDIKVPSLGLMEEGLSGLFIFTQAPADQISGENICR